MDNEQNIMIDIDKPDRPNDLYISATRIVLDR